MSSSYFLSPVSFTQFIHILASHRVLWTNQFLSFLLPSAGRGRGVSSQLVKAPGSIFVGATEAQTGQDKSWVISAGCGVEASRLLWPLVRREG